MQSKNVKVVVFVPESHAGRVRLAMGEAGAGRIGNYTHCSFSTKGIGRFRGEKGAKPTVGKAGRIEEVPEERIEMVCDRRLLKKVISAIKEVHPYEEVPIYVYPLIDADSCAD